MFQLDCIIMYWRIYVLLAIALFLSQASSHCLKCSNMVSCAGSSEEIINGVHSLVDTTIVTLEIIDGRIENGTLYEPTFDIQKNAVTTIKIAKTNLRAVEGFAFKNFTNAQILNLTDNQIQYISNDAFANLRVLYNLYLDHNPLYNTDCRLFENAANLKILSLANTLRDSYTCAGWNLNTLNLRNNSLTNLNVRELVLRNPLIKNVYIQNNQFSCSYLTELVSDFAKFGLSYVLPTELYVSPINNVNGVICRK